MTDDRSSALTQDQHAPVLPLAPQDDVTSLSVRQLAAWSSYLQQQSTDLIQSDLQRRKAFEPFGNDFCGGHQIKILFAIKRGESGLLQGAITFYLSDGA